MNTDLLAKLIAYQDIFKFLPDLKYYYEKYTELKDKYNCKQEPFKLLLKKYKNSSNLLKFVELSFDSNLNKYVQLKNKEQTFYPRLY